MTVYAIAEKASATCNISFSLRWSDFFFSLQAADIIKSQSVPTANSKPGKNYFSNLFTRFRSLFTSSRTA